MCGKKVINMNQKDFLNQMLNRSVDLIINLLSACFPHIHTHACMTELGTA